MKRATREILLSAAALEPGERDRILCPACGGGSKAEKSLSISVDVDGTVRWNCFRASCDEHGRGGEQRRVQPRTRFEPRKQTVRPYEGELRWTTDEENAFLAEKIGWQEDHIVMARPKYAPEDDRYAFPIYSPINVRRGYVLRSYTGGEPKALIRAEIAEPYMSWYAPHDGGETWVVEDIPSAVRLAKYVNAVALNGTGVGHDYAQELAAHAPNVVWALDADASALAVRTHRKHGILFDSSRVVILGEDVKDMPEEDIKELVGWTQNNQNW